MRENRGIGEAKKKNDWRKTWLKEEDAHCTHCDTQREEKEEDEYDRHQSWELGS